MKYQQMKKSRPKTGVTSHATDGNRMNLQFILHMQFLHQSKKWAEDFCSELQGGHTVVNKSPAVQS